MNAAAAARAESQVCASGKKFGIENSVRAKSERTNFAQNGVREYGLDIRATQTNILLACVMAQ